MFKTPHFWRHRNITARMLLPLAALYQIGYHLRRLMTTPVSVTTPILCVGNLVAGGAGKTPIARAIGEMLKQHGIRACYVSRGYGGTVDSATPLLVNTLYHRAGDVGDEPLLLAYTLPTIVCKSRRKGVEYASTKGFQLIIMDDGFQNPNIRPDFSLLVADSHYRFGNELTFPAGPLREPVASGIRRADMMLWVHRNGLPSTALPVLPIPTTSARLVTVTSAPINGKRVLAFCGIAHPDAFFLALPQLGAEIVGRRAFPDHHYFTEAECNKLFAHAEKLDAVLVTTAKDAIRLPEALQSQVIIADLAVSWQDSSFFEQVITKVLRT